MRAYYTGSQTQVYIGRAIAEEVFGIRYRSNSGTTPYYGYASKHFDAVIRGKYIIEGEILVYYNKVKYFWTLLMGSMEDKATIAAALSVAAIPAPGRDFSSLTSLGPKLSEPLVVPGNETKTAANIIKAINDNPDSVAAIKDAVESETIPSNVDDYFSYLPTTTPLNEKDIFQIYTPDISTGAATEPNSPFSYTNVGPDGSDIDDISQVSLPSGYLDNVNTRSAAAAKSSTVVSTTAGGSASKDREALKSLANYLNKDIDEMFASSEVDLAGPFTIRIGTGIDKSGRPILMDQLDGCFLTGKQRDYAQNDQILCTGYSFFARSER